MEAFQTRSCEAKVFLRRNMVTKITLFIQSNNEVDDVFPCSFILVEEWFQSQLLVTGSLKYIEVIDFEYFLHIIFDRFTWDALHTWTGVFMIIALVVHFTLHWSWVLMMGKRIIELLRSGGMNMSSGSKLNLAVNLVVALSFLATAVSGIYFLYLSPGGIQGGRNLSWDPNLVFNRTTWDLIHTWAGVIFILAAVVHFAIHWRWAVMVTKRLLGSLLSRFAPRRVQEKMLA